MIETHAHLKPVWIVRLAGRVSEHDIREIAGLVERMHREDQSMLVVDGRGVRFPEASVRKALGELTANSEPNGRGRTRAVSILVDSSALAGAVRAVLWFVSEAAMTRVARRPEEVADHLQSLAPDLLSTSLKEAMLEVIAEPLSATDDSQSGTGQDESSSTAVANTPG